MKHLVCTHSEHSSNFMTHMFIDEKMELTGHCLKDIEAGDTISTPAIKDSHPRVLEFVVKDIIERRDHRGVFRNSEHKKNSFYRLKVDFLKNAL